MKKIFQAMSPVLVALTALLSGCAPASTPIPASSTPSLIPSTLTSQPTTTPTATFTPAPTPTPLGGGKNTLIVNTNDEIFAPFFPNLEGKWHVFLVNLDGSGFAPITANLPSYNFLENVSPDGRKILISSNPRLRERGYEYGDLWVMNVDGSNAVKLSSAFFTRPDTTPQQATAYWFSENRIIFIAEESNERAIFSINSDGTNLFQISNPGSHAVELIPSPDEGIIYYIGGRPGMPPNYTSGSWKINIDGSGEEKIWEGLSVADISRSRNRIIFSEARDNYNFFAADFDGSNKIDFDSESCWPCHILSPDGMKLIFFKNNQSHLLSFHDSQTTIIPNIHLFFMNWSPDSRLILSRYGDTPQIINTETMEIKEIPIRVKLPWSKFLRVYWLPASTN